MKKHKKPSVSLIIFIVVFIIFESIFISGALKNSKLNFGEFCAYTGVAIALGALLSGKIKVDADASSCAYRYGTDLGTGKIISELEKKNKENKQ